MQWSGPNEISPRNNLEDAEVAVKKPRLRIRQGKTGCNGRDAMRFHCVIILLESHILPESRGAARGVTDSEIVALHAARDVTDSEIVDLHAARGVIRSTAMNCGTPWFFPPRVLPRFVLAASGAAMKQKRTRSRFLPIICPSRFTFPSLARQDVYSRASNGFVGSRATQPTK